MKPVCLPNPEVLVPPARGDGMDEILTPEWQDLSKPETDILCLLAAESPLSVTGVNQALGRDEQNRKVISQNLKKLRRKGLLRGSRDTTAPGHPHLHELSDAGERLVKLNVVRLARLIETREVLES